MIVASGFVSVMAAEARLATSAAINKVSTISKSTFGNSSSSKLGVKAEPILITAEPSPTAAERREKTENEH